MKIITFVAKTGFPVNTQYFRYPLATPLELFQEDQTSCPCVYLIRFIDSVIRALQWQMNYRNFNNYGDSPANFCGPLTVCCVKTYNL